MMEGFRPKPKEELESQAQVVSSILGTEIEQKNNIDTIYDLTLDEIRSKYPERYRVYLKLLRASRRGEEISSKTIQEFKSWIQALNNLDAYIENHKGNLDRRILRDRQLTVFEDIRNHLEEGKIEGYVKLPTGVGKTILFSQIVKSFNVKTLVVVPSKILVEQTGDRFEEFTDKEFGLYYQEVKDASQDVTIITYFSLMRALRYGTINPDDYELLVLDEAHKALGDKTVEAIDQFNCVKLGFSATPEYSKKKKVSNILEHEMHNLSIVEAVRDGLISRFKSIFAFTETDLSEVSIKENGEYDEKQLEKAVNVYSRNLSAVKLYKEMFSGQSAVAYCSGVNHAHALANLFKSNGVSAAVISGKTPKKERKDILKKFKTGEIKVLCNAKLLIEGFDEPRASVAFNLHPTLSKVDAEQRAGRVLRLDRDNPDKWAYVIDFIDKNAQKSSITFPEIAESAEEQSWVSDEDREILRRTTFPKDTGVRGYSGIHTSIEIEGLSVMVDAQEVFAVSQQLMETRADLKQALEGWATPNAVANEISSDRKSIVKFADQFKPEHPEWFGMYRAGFNDHEHYSPELIRLIKAKFAIDRAPEGWISAPKLARLIGSDPKTLAKRYEEVYKEEHPEWFGMYKIGAKVAIHYSPELTAIVKKEISSRKAPEGWVSATRLEKEVGAAAATIKAFAEGYRAEHPEWFGMYSKSTREGLNFAPELVSIIREKFKSELPPEGWINSKKLQRELLGPAQETIERFAEGYRAEHPEWFAMYKAGSTKAEHYSPELVEIIRARYKKET